MRYRFPHVNEAVATRDFKYYIFDWDDNILHMTTKIRLEHLQGDGTWKPVEVSTSKFAEVRCDKNYRAPQAGGWDDAFRYFADDAGYSHFIEDTVAALERVEHGEKPGPSYNALKKTLREGRLFAIVTARGHSSAAIERAVRVFIKYALSEEEREEMLSNLRGYRRVYENAETFGSDVEEVDIYLSRCQFNAVTNKDFLEKMERDPIYNERLLTFKNASKPELAKEYAIREFVEKIFGMLRRRGCLNRPVSIGFSDDDKRNVKNISDYIKEDLAKRFEGIKFVVYDTSDRSLDKGRKVCVSGQENLPGF